MDALRVKTVLDNLTQTPCNATLESKAIHTSKIDLMTWLYNGGNLRTAEEVQTKYDSIQEEILVCEFAEEFGYVYDSAKQRLALFQSVTSET